MSTRARLAATEPLLARLEGGDTAAHEAGRRLARELLEAHRAALARALEMIGEAPGGEPLLRRLGADAEVAALLMLHGLHPEDLATRVHRAVAALAPRLAAAGARLTLAGLGDGGVVRLRLEHAGTRGALHAPIEEALAAAAADAAAIEIEESVLAPLRFAPPARARP